MNDLTVCIGKRRLPSLSWAGFNLVLLGCYLGFFHLCLVVVFPWSFVIGIIVACLTMAICLRFRNLFVNRFEFLLHLAIPLDIAIEGMIPLHSGYSFYYCAAAFWLVFILYRMSYTKKAR